jgi:hypothetical protein
MAKATLAERTVYTNLDYIRITPWSTEISGPDGATYDVTEVVGDTTTVEQAENDVNVIESEFRSTPLYENTILGDKTFTCESIDLQNEVLKGLFGWTVDSEGNAYAPTAYKHLYATIELGFQSTDNVIVLPKVLLNSRAVIASMKTDTSRANIAGTCYTAFVNGEETDMALLKEAKADDDGAAVLALVKAGKTA